jgi:transposase
LSTAACIAEQHASKNVSGRKRHVLVDTLGLVLLVVVTAANAQDRTAAADTASWAIHRVPGVNVAGIGFARAGQVIMGSANQLSTSRCLLDLTGATS